MALSAYAYFKDGDGNAIKGSVTLPDYEQSCEVIGWDHEVARPFDPETGRGTGRPQHGLLLLTKPYDVASPILQQALFDGTELQSLELHCIRPSPAGTEEHYLTIELEKVLVMQCRVEQLNNKYPENLSHAIREHVKLAYYRIQYIWVENRLGSIDEWLNL